MKGRTLDPEAWVIELRALDEHCPLDEDHAGSGLEWARENVNVTEWAWCCAHVQASHPDLPSIVGDAYLGCCMYESEEAFRADPYFADLVDEAKADALDHARLVVARADKLRAVIGGAS